MKIVEMKLIGYGLILKLDSPVFFLGENYRRSGKTVCFFKMDIDTVMFCGVKCDTYY